MMKSRDCSIKVNKSNIFTVVKRRQKQPLRGVLQNSCFTKRFSFCICSVSIVKIHVLFKNINSFSGVKHLQVVTSEDVE